MSSEVSLSTIHRPPQTGLATISAGFDSWHWLIVIYFGVIFRRSNSSNVSAPAADSDRCAQVALDPINSPNI